MMSLLQSMSTRGKLLLGGSLLGVVLVSFLMVQMATKPTYTTLAAGLDPAQTGKITQALDAQGITNQPGNGGTSVEVTSADIARARIALASAGLSATGGSSDGWAQFDKQKLGSSNFQQQVAYQRALEAQIAQTVGQVDGVQNATVQLTMPQEQLFADQQQPATASVLLGGGPSTLQPGAVRGIANLVASAVPNLKSSNVTITDGSGQMLWPTGDQADGGVASKPAAEARYDAQLSAQLDAIVAQTVGVGKGEVRVASDLNVDATTKDELQYSKTGTPLTTTKDTERLKGTGAAGINTARGDTIATSVVPFAKPTATATPAGSMVNIIGYAKYAGVGLASLLFLFFMRRALRRRETADLMGEPVWLSQIESPRPVGELSAGGTHALAGGSEAGLLTSAPNRRRQQVEQAVSREPERVVQALRAWMAEDEVSSGS